MQNYKEKIIQLILWLAFLTTFVSGQEKTGEAAIRVETRLVSVDVLVHDKNSRQPIIDLKREDFMLKVDGKTRDIDQFGLKVSERCPLTLILYFNLMPGGALRYLKQPKARKSLNESLAKLDEKDEVALITAPDWFVGKPKLIINPTRNREEISRSLSEMLNDADLNGKTTEKKTNRTMTQAIAAVEKIAAEKPDREIALVYISDGINTLDTMSFKDRKELVTRLWKNYISFSALNFDMLNSYSTAAAIINPVAFAFGASVTESANYLAEQSGGMSIKVDKAEDLGSSLEAIINLYRSRYSLGFYLDETDNADGKMYKIEVKVKSSAKSKLLISVRRGFYIKR